MFKNGLVWFRNDLRLHDQKTVNYAANNCKHLVCVYVLEDHLEENYPSFSFPKMGTFRTHFLLESLLDLKQQLIRKNSDLLVLKGKAETILPELVNHFDIDWIGFQSEPAYEERSLERKVVSKLEPSVTVQRTWDNALFHLKELPFKVEMVPNGFTSFRKKVEKQDRIGVPIPEPSTLPPWPQKAHSLYEEVPITHLLSQKPVPHAHSAFPFEGGETKGLERLNYYVWESKLLSTYKETRNELLGTDFSSKFSVWLANGTLSPRKIVSEIRAFEQQHVKNESTYWLVFELLWREYWRLQFIRHKNSFFKEKGIQPHKSIQWKKSDTLFEAWKEGKTGFPIVDANMRELTQTGFMSNRGRQIVASFFAKNLEIDWRLGAAWFESQLIDYDVYSNWGNWAYVAGVGNDSRDRYFNINTQVEKYDPDGTYIKTWLPELNNVPGKLLTHYHTLETYEKKMYEQEGTDSYPLPIIDLEASYKKLRSK